MEGDDSDLDIPYVDLLGNTFDNTKCILCQRKGKLTTGDNGRKRIIEASERKCDIAVKKRIKLASTDPFVYHLDYKCYKSYTRIENEEHISLTSSPVIEDLDRKDSEQDNEFCIRNKSTRSMASPRAEHCSSKSDKRHIERVVKCIICANISHKKVYAKYRISEDDVAKKFLESANHLKDDVFERVADINDSSRLFAADIYYHASCLKQYLRRYDDSIKKYESPSTSNVQRSSVDEKKSSFIKILPHLKQQLALGNGFTLSEIRDFIKKKGNVELHNFQVKELLIDELGENITFCDSKCKNESSMVFSTHLSPEVLSRKIMSINVLKESATILRQELQSTNFNLKDEFKDRINIENSWKSTPIPENFLYFLSELFQIPQTQLSSLDNESDDLKDDLSADEEEFEEIHEEENEDNDDNYSKRKTQIFCLFQTMFYVMHQGKRPTPLHLLTGHSIYHKCKGKQLITAMNKIGISISYSEVRRTRTQLTLFIKDSCIDNKTPLPSHFSKSDFTMGALDNADFKDTSSQSGTKSSHDTVMVIFQNCEVKIKKKPKLSETKIDKSRRKLLTHLPCQEIKECSKPTSTSSLPATFLVKGHGDTSRIDVLVSEASMRYEKLEFLISLIKSGLPLIDSRDVPTWAGFHALISSSEVSLKRVAFLPVIPRPVTEYATVYTAMKNFQEILFQLDQPIFPFFSDEGVFHTVVEIILDHPNEFCNLYAMMGMIHMAKAGLHCAGKMLAGSGIDSLLEQACVFGKKTLDSVLSGGHYVRALKGMLIVSEAIRSLQWKAFWLQNTGSKYEDFIADAVILSNALSNRNEIKSIKSQFQNISFDTKSEELKKDFESFTESAANSSEQCKYLEMYLKVVRAITNLVASDRNGDWGLHVSAVGKLLPFFSACDSINYLRYGAYYYKKIQSLEKEHPSLYLEFMKGNFVVKTKEAKFNAVAPDLKLEQTIQRAQKDPKGIIGQNRKDEYVAQWQVHLTTSETYIHHEMNDRVIHEMNESVVKLADLLGKDGNPYVAAANTSLHNFVTKEILPIENKTYLLNIFDIGTGHYSEFRNVRFVQRAKKLFDRISTLRFKGFLVAKAKAVSVKAAGKSILKDLAAVQQQIDIAKERGLHIKDILRYDFPIDSVMPSMSNPNKSSILKDLESNLEQNEYNFDCKSDALDTSIVVDFMSVVRSTNFKRFKSFGEALDFIWENISSVCHTKVIHFIYDSYLQYSIKDVERSKRKSGSEASGVILSEISFDVPIPKEMNSFWIETSNKVQLQDFARQYLKQKYDSSIDIVLSGVLCGEDTLNADSLPAVTILPDKQENKIGLALMVEEADMRIIPHVMESIKIRNCKRIVVLANDTDVVILLLRYMGKFMEEGAHEIWIRIGLQEKKRFIPIHTLYNKLGATFCHVLLKAYIASGCDWLSHIGSKQAALKADPVKYLQEFGEDSNPSADILAKAERYLVNIYKPNTELQTLDELRYMKYRSKVSVAELPPSSYCIQNGHI